MLIRQPIKKVATGNRHFSKRRCQAITWRRAPYLYENTLDQIKEETTELVVNYIHSDDIGDELIQLINQIDAARHNLKNTTSLLPLLKGNIQKLTEGTGDYLSGKLQQFLN